MTPLIDFVLRNFDHYREVWMPEVSGIQDAKGFAQAIYEAKWFLVPEAERDTFALYDMAPTYMATCRGVRMPAEVCWIEFPMQPAIGQKVEGQRAFLAVQKGEGGILVFSISTNWNLLQVVTAFAIEPDCVGTNHSLEEAGLKVRQSDWWVMLNGEDRGGTQARFFVELLQLLNHPVLDLSVSERRAKEGLTRRLQRLAGRRYPQPTLTTVTLRDRPDGAVERGLLRVHHPLGAAH